jgi:hypothetical protein
MKIGQKNFAVHPKKIFLFASVLSTPGISEIRDLLYNAFDLSTKPTVFITMVTFCGCRRLMKENH